MTKKSRMRRLGGALAVCLAVGLVPTAASAGPPSDKGCQQRQLRDVEQVLECVDGDDAFDHLSALQAIADANGGTRVSGTSGYDQSVDYVVDTLDAAGWDVERQAFEFFTYIELASSVTLDGDEIGDGTFTYSGSGSVADANVVPVDLDLGLGNASTSGCEAADFVGLDFSGDNDLALIQRGACAFGLKAQNAQDAGAEAVIIFNQGNADGRFGTINGTLGADAAGVITIPVLNITYDEAIDYLDNGGVLSASANTVSGIRETENVIAELPGTNADNVVMAGAHLDSVSQGPGIQDNGSGSAALMALAETLGTNVKYTPQNTLRFAWWGAEESGLIGSDFYVGDLSAEELDKIAAYVNFDMIASPNFIYGVYDADESSFAAPVVVPEGSEELEDLFEAYYSYNDIPYEDTQFSGRSDYQAFIEAGVPASGLFTGAEVLKTAEQEAIWGGIAGEQFDQCYHLACDTIDNVSAEAMDVNVDAVAYAVTSLAASTEAVNGVPGGKLGGPTVDKVELDGPQGTFLDGGGGLSPDHDHDHDHAGDDS